jgi:hypothetical protein
MNDQFPNNVFICSVGARILVHLPQQAAQEVLPRHQRPLRHRPITTERRLMIRLFIVSDILVGYKDHDLLISSDL